MYFSLARPILGPILGPIIGLELLFDTVNPMFDEYGNQLAVRREGDRTVIVSLGI